MEELTAIERLKRRLYSRNGGVGIARRAAPSREVSDVSRSWGSQPTAERPASRRDWDTTLRAFLWGSLIFFAGSVTIAGFIFLRGGNVVSSENISLEVLGPSLVDGGKEVTLQVIVKNDNQVALELADLIVRYPEGTRSAENINAPLPEVRESLGTIGPGEQVKTTVSAILFGEEGASRRIGASLEYRVQGSNAVFVKEGGADLTIGSSPVTLLVEGPEEASAGREASFKLTISSNSPEEVRGVVVEAEYPFGFTVTSASPETVVGDGLWQLGTLAPRETKTIQIQGTMEAQDNEERVFRFSVGSQRSPSDVTLAVPFVTIPHTLTVKRAFITGELAIGGQTGKTVSVGSGKPVSATFTWRNNLDAEAHDVEFEAYLEGEAIDRSSVSASGGFYRSATNSIVWNRETSDDFAVVAPGRGGTLNFTFIPRNTGASGALLKNPELTVRVEVSAKRFNESGSTEAPSAIASKRVLVSSPLTLQASARHFSGAFSNGGPMPPKADQETTYTIVWSIQNPSNTIANARVVASLPPSVRFLSRISPASESVSFNTSNKTVTWDIGELKTTSAPRTVSFQVGLTPSVSQIGQSATLIGDAVFSGDDRFAQTRVSASASSVTTQLGSEPGYLEGMGTVAP